MSKESSQVLHYLVELRSRLIKALTITLFVFAIFTYFANDLYTLLAQPLLKFLPQGHLIATQIVSPFFVPFKLAFLASVLICAPVFLYQLWQFIAPALYGYERQMVWPLLFVSSFLFYTGLAFAYFVIFPILFHFLATTAPKGVMLSPDISEYFDFTTKMLIVFGALFEIPIIMLVLSLLGIVTVKRFRELRRYAIVSSFVLGMLLAPPDVLSQTLLAIPIWMLYESGIVLARIFPGCRFAPPRLPK